MIRFCITGPDGAGKSTLAAAVAETLDAHHGPGTAAHVQVWDSLRPLLDRRTAQQYLGQIGHRSRSLLLLHAVSRALELAEASEPRVLVLDGYWYKYAVSELEHGGPAALFASCGDLFPTPEVTVFLDLSVQEAQRRKAELTAYERGFGSDPQAFVGFQSRLRRRWAELEDTCGPWLHLAATRAPEVLVDQVLAQIEPLLGHREPSPTGGPGR